MVQIWLLEISFRSNWCLRILRICIWLYNFCCHSIRSRHNVWIFFFMLTCASKFWYAFIATKENYSLGCFQDNRFFNLCLFSLGSIRAKSGAAFLWLFHFFFFALLFTNRWLLFLLRWCYQLKRFYLFTLKLSCSSSSFDERKFFSSFFIFFICASYNAFFFFANDVYWLTKLLLGKKNSE